MILESWCDADNGDMIITTIKYEWRPVPNSGWLFPEKKKVKIKKKFIGSCTCWQRYPWYTRASLIEEGSLHCLWSAITAGRHDDKETPNDQT